MSKGKARQAPTRSSARLQTSNKSLDESAHSLPEEGTRLNSSTIPVDNGHSGLSSGTSPSVSELHSTARTDIPQGREGSASRTRRNTTATLSPVQRKSMKRSHKQANSGQTSGTKGVFASAASSPIHKFFQQPSKEFRKNIKHVPSTKTRPFHPFDQHLHPDLRLNEVVVLDTLPTILSQYCDDIIEENADYLRTAGPLPDAPSQPNAVRNEEALVNEYIKSNQACLQVASGLLFKKGWEDIFNMTKPNKVERQEGIADVLISIDPETGGKHLTAKHRSDLKLLRKYLLDVFVTLEFKSLVAAPHIFEDLLRLEGKFPWSTCQERTDDNEKSTTCRASAGNAHRVNGRLQTTGRPTSPDSSIILQLIEDARSQERPPKRLKADLDNLSKTAAKQDSVYACQQIWTQLVVEDASVAIFSSGNEEFVAIRDRGKQTLYLSPMIKCTSNSSITHSKILVACILLGFNDALERARQLEAMSTVPGSEVSPGYRINVDRLPFYVKKNLTAELFNKVRSEQTHPQNYDQVIISLFENCSDIQIRFHDSSISERLGGPPGATTWHLQKRGSHRDAVDLEPEPSGRLFLDFNYESQLDKKVFVVYLGLVEEEPRNAPKYYSKPLFMKLTRNAPLSKMLEVEHDNYADLRAKGVRAIVQVYGLFENPDLPNHRFLILESGGKPVTLETTAHCKRFKGSYLAALNSFHDVDISIGNIMNDHIVMNKERDVFVVSLAHVSQPATSSVKRDEVKAFHNAIRAFPSFDITTTKEALPTGNAVSSSESEG
uniref:Uncharacterized protein n=1 Tax=Psilocybe cubensis TaxID=181762 RepID=A0A8H7Y944_PSICU